MIRNAADNAATTPAANPTDELLLASILDDLWQQLERATQDPGHAWHWPILATVARDTEDSPAIPDARTVVLRNTDKTSNWLEAHTDTLAAKCEQLRRQPVALLTSYDPRSRIQLRIRGPITLHHDDNIARNAWQTLHESSRQQYAGIDRFTVMRLRAQSIDWLSLASEPHRRARFTAACDGSPPKAQFIAP